LLVLLRFPQELVDVSDYKLPEGGAAKWRISEKEMAMAKQLIESMAGKWEPEKYRDEFRDRLHKVIETRMKSKGLVSRPEEGETAIPENAATNVVDFMSLLKKSLETKKRTPPRKASAKKASAAKSPARKPAAKKGAKPAAVKSARRRRA
jgi:DNA end-binding protein Ku